MAVPMRSVIKFEWILSNDPFTRGERGRQVIDVVDDSHLHGDSRTFVVPASSTDYELDFSKIITNGAMLFLRAQAACSIKINSSGASAIPLTLLSEQGEAYFMLTSDVTKIYVTTGGSNTTISLSIIGDSL
jgi:hypothetical protein